MKTELLSSDEIERAAALLKRGELVAFPTETVYGLGALISQERALRKIFEVKGRAQDNPLIVHIADFDQLELPKNFAPLAEAFMPGPLTLVLRSGIQFSSTIRAGLDTIAIRMPNHPVARALIKAAGKPIAAPSANLSGKPSSTSAQHVLEDFEGRIAAVLDGGICEGGIESTVLSLVDKPLILRPGTITKAEIEKVLGAQVELYRPQKGERPLSPGMAHRHYAPRAPLRFFHAIEELKNRPLEQYMILATEQIPGYKTCLLTHKTLYALLRQSDREGVQEILVFCNDALLEDQALMNRLQHAVACN